MAVWVARIWGALARLAGGLVWRATAGRRALRPSAAAPRPVWHRLAAARAAAIAAQRGQMFVWAPVFLGLGIAGFFALAREPDRTAFALAAGALALALAARAVRPRRRAAPGAPAASAATSRAGAAGRAASAAFAPPGRPAAGWPPAGRRAG